MKMILIDASNLLVGRIASFAAKKALLGEEIAIINCDNAFVAGSKKNLMADFSKKRARGTHTTGPYYPRYPEQIVKRTIRGMLPWARTRGREAYSRIKCYVGVPQEFKEIKPITIQSADISKLPNLKYMDLKTISNYLGAKSE